MKILNDVLNSCETKEFKISDNQDNNILMGVFKGKDRIKNVYCYTDNQMNGLSRVLLSTMGTGRQCSTWEVLMKMKKIYR